MSRLRFPKIAGILVVCALAVTLGAHLSHVLTAQNEAIVDPATLGLAKIVPPPPPPGSRMARAELEELFRIQQSRTPAQVAAAQADEKEEDIFVYRSVLGDRFDAADLPLTAALSGRVHNEEEVSSAPLKAEYHRVRPYNADSELHPVCGTTKKPNSYPSGHSISGYLEAFTLAEMVPEKRDQILARADEYAHNRMVCGVHYPSDIAAGREVAYAVFGAMMADPAFKTQLAAARAETRKRLGMN